MHIWPSMKIRDSFKISYLKNVEWNLDRMNSQKQFEASQKPLDGDKVSARNENPSSATNTKSRASWIVALFWDLLMILSCCYCCGVFDPEDDSEQLLS
ncbi:hypothetical protein Nepgr_001233 [Nepenthes gracilis]|uniref:Uncharacterized protein n=1 Tax=Nepenthes gracilis TaxID=150966 RepID=A0AAD3P7W5_NEPGR|nr:hypothetical protein Nepgr_001233 [Nepenthes gracilis]